MPDKNAEFSPIDRDLASFTDSLLSSEDSDDDALYSADHELRQLQDTVAYLTQTYASDEVPDKATATRISNVLTAEWHSLHTDQKEEPISFWKNIQDSLQQSFRQPAFGLVVAAVTIVIAGLVLVVPPVDGNTTSGAAMGEVSTIVIALGVIVGGVLWWIARRKK